MDEAQRTGELVLVATPLGNLGDLSPRALEYLARADVVYCEDTRRSRTLFSAFSVPSGGRLKALHEHNEAKESLVVVERVRRGEVVVLISDAGTPGISDPGERVVAAVAAAGLRVTTTPGPSAVVAALSVSGLSTERFVMEGFLPRTAGERRRRYDQWDHEPRTIVFFESPQRVAAVMDELRQRDPDRRVVVVRELTKIHEEVLRATVGELAEVLKGRDVVGEIVVVLAGAVAHDVVSDDVVVAALNDERREGASTRDAVEHVAKLLGLSRRAVYQRALEVRDAPDQVGDAD